VVPVLFTYIDQLNAAIINTFNRLRGVTPSPATTPAVESWPEPHRVGK
jgi:hypothetical protein